MATTPGSPSAVPPSPPRGTPGPPLDPVAAIAAGWRAFLANPWMSIGVAVVMFAIGVVGQLIPFVNLLFALLVAPALYAGCAWFYLRGVRNENPPFETAFEGFQRWPAVTGALLLVFLVAFAIMIPMFLVMFGVAGVTAILSSRPGEVSDMAPAAMLPMFAAILVTYPVLIWWSTRSYLTLFIVMEADRPSPVEAVKRSFALTGGSVWRLIALYLLWIPVALVGLLALCVGVIPASTVIGYSFAHAYEQLRRRAGG